MFRKFRTGSAKDVRFQWQKNNGSEWVPLTDASVHVGEYKVIAILDGDTNYTSASAEKTFTISVAENTWTETPAIADITYGTAPAPTAKAPVGTVQFTYSSTQDGTYGELPENAPVGTWYLKAEVPSTEDYSGLSTILEFHITKAKAPEPVIPEGLYLPSGCSSLQHNAFGRMGLAEQQPESICRQRRLYGTSDGG